MFGYSIEVIETIAILLGVIGMRLFSRSAVSKALRKFSFTVQRRKLTVKIINFFVSGFGILAISAVWGIKQHELFLFFSSLVTVLGIAFFAQWSLLSNITSGLILFFNHPVKLGDTIEIHDKDYPIVGSVRDIGYYFLHIETKSGERLTIPNSVFLQKMISVKSSSQH
jgi:small-conductance mechanosensitive channel